MLPSNWRQWFFAPARTSRVSRRSRGYQPLVESMEDRLIPSVSPMGLQNLTFVEGSTQTTAVASFTSTDLAPQSPTNYRSSIDWGDGKSTLGMIMPGPDGYSVFGTHAYTEEGNNYSIHVQITDAAGSSVTASSTATVTDAALSASGSMLMATEGSPLNNGIVATFSDANLSATASDFSATITWGDNTTSTGTVQANSAGGFTVQGSHTYGEQGTYATGVQITEKGGSSASATGNVFVGEAPLTSSGTIFSATTGNPFNGAVASFSDANPLAQATDFNATIYWGDMSSSSAGTIKANTTGGFDVLGSHTYSQSGSHLITVQITEVAGSGSTTANGTALVSSVPLAVSGTPISTTEGTQFTGVVASFTDADPLATATDYSVSLTWGDGGTSMGMVTSNGAGGFDVSGTHFYTEAGSYAVSVQILSIHGSSGVAGTTALVADAPLTATGNTFNATEGLSFNNAVVATFSDGNSVPAYTDTSVTISWGDGTTSPGTIQTTGPGTGQVLGSHTCADEGTYTISVQITDAGGSMAQASSTAQVLDAQLMANVYSFNATPGTVYSGTVAFFFDNNPSSSASEFNASIDWGDGTTTTGTVQRSPATGFDVIGSHTYTSSGSYTVSVQITDIVGGSSTQVSGTAFVSTMPAPVDPPAPVAPPAPVLPPVTPATRAPVVSPVAATPAPAASSVVSAPAHSTESLLAVGADSGLLPEVKVYDAETGALKFDFLAFASSFRGGVRVAVADVNGDGVQDIICAAGPGGGPQVRVFDGTTGQAFAGTLGSFYAIQPGSFTGGIFVAAGDVNGDGCADIIVGADAGGGPQVTVFSGKDGAMLSAFNAFDPRFTGGVRVAAGDVNGDGKADIIAGMGAGNLPAVSITDGATFRPLASFLAFAPAFRGGVSVAAVDVNGDGRADVITGAGPGGAPQVVVFDGRSLAMLDSFYAFDARFTRGVRVAGKQDSSGRARLVAAMGQGGNPQVAEFDGRSLSTLDQFFAYDPTSVGGLYIG
jgi:hypothetical protein